MAFTSEHMNALAAVVADNRLTGMSPELMSARHVAHALADMLEADTPVFDNNGNRRFDRARFLRACGVEG